MSYEEKLNSAVRTKIELVKIKADYCNNNFGSSPCSALGEKCYNTFPTCSDKKNFKKVVKDYTFISNDVPAEVAREYFPARPYLINISDLPTEIKEENTVVKRVKITLADEPDTDIGIDPYLNERANAKGHFWRKWLSRNRYYKGRIVEIWDGFAGLPISEFKRKFAGKIEGISYKNNSVTIESVDLLSELSKIKYPLETDVKTIERVPAVHVVGSESEITNLNAQVGDFAKVNAFKRWPLAARAVGSGNLAGATYFLKIIGYDNSNRPFKIGDCKVLVVSDWGQGSITFNLFAENLLTKYKVFIRKATFDGKWLHDYKFYGVFVPGNPHSEITIRRMPTEVQEIPKDAEYYMLLNDADPSKSDNWSHYVYSMNIPIEKQGNLDYSGCVKIDDEIIRYDSIGWYFLPSGKVYGLKNVQRMQFGTEGSEHDPDTVIRSLIEEVPENPFTLLIKMLKKGKISDEFIDQKFYEYRDSWNGLKFSTKVIVAETTLDKIYFDLVNILDCISWVGEDGEIKILKYNESPKEIIEITDDANIVEGSANYDLNEKSNYTQWFIYWNRFDVEKEIDKKESYNKVRALVDADAESGFEQNESIPKTFTSTWINLEGNTQDKIDNYLDDLLEKRRVRTRDNKFIFSCDLEMKDSKIKTGDFIYLTTDKIETVTGEPVNKKEVRVVKKTNKKNKFNIKLLEK